MIIQAACVVYQIKATMQELEYHFLLTEYNIYIYIYIYIYIKRERERERESESIHSSDLFNSSSDAVKAFMDRDNLPSSALTLSTRT
jgi:hypothetical protein